MQDEQWRGRVERLGWGGAGLARHADGRLIILEAPLALFPGEEVEARVRFKRRHGEGEVVRWLTPDARRVEPECPVARECGGCRLWGAGTAHAELKQQFARDLFQRQLPAAPEWEYLPAPPAARRQRIQLHWDGSALGYHARRSHTLVPISACPAACPELSAAVPALHDALAAGRLPDAPARWELATGTPPGEVAASLSPERVWRLTDSGWQPDAAPLEHHLGGHDYHQQPGTFMQAAPPWAWSAFSTLVAQWGLSAGLLADIYGGSGFFSLLMAERWQRAVLVEESETACALARRNLAGLAVEVVAADAGAWFRTQAARLAAAPGGALILLDPPRAGLPEDMARLLAELPAATSYRTPPRVLLIGCDGASFCRDVRRITAGGQWQLSRLAAIDLFPLTPELECAGLLSVVNSQ